MLGPMHEWALAEAVLEATAAAMAGRPPEALRTVNVLLGELQAIDRDIFAFALGELARGGAFARAAFALETQPARFGCARCAAAWSLDQAAAADERAREAIHFLPESAHAFMRCPACGSPDFTVLAGRGVSIASIELEEEA
jgi:hydrogenase nickel incorporation protein HypA/HybF